ncbi:helix-turn-helix domain-containing protein [Amycolatopsis tucumanensis]|uniref:AraC family transcriptional regulator n=1 Tax=Amycolatopsis tucumanensis TaxID=401106 RepID=A0ABP7JAK2_9PSEU|nr:AraC family transcriptional regulator [Amycolatopsis tucumanensis]MCF6421732.1 AraC family transcriptional regulator [Amycolatopsis tucumanensis]
MFGALAFDLDSVANLRLCSWRDNGWRSLLIRSYANDPVAEEVLLPATAEQTLVLITSGTKTIESRAGARWHSAEYGPGRIGLTAPHQEAHLRWRGAPTTSINVYLPAGLLERTAAELFGRGASRVSRPDALAADDPVLAAVLTGLGDAALAGADELYAETAAAFIAAHLLTRHASAPEPAPVRAEDIRVRQAVSFIQDNHHLPLTLAEMAAAVELSPFHFLRVFKAATGTTPYRFLNTVRIDRARRYLGRTDLPVSDIAHLCGFTSPSRLAIAFRRETGVSPTAFRDQQQ